MGFASIVTVDELDQGMTCRGLEIGQTMQCTHVIHLQ